ncbi:MULTISPECIES: hypothetical protein [unclassified Leptospira]|uniref:hypothetical protein n=1 Tax=unclassified Leptospira TaxID=2633828 RepID=UPI0002BEB8A4|nr:MULTISPECIES: hypothetical protein [unclassified Leptospira]EMJ97798.1 hypothetical protein LEP1GSC192_3136 [Leptospira sp. B5-022]EMK01091.1 hypothetical protein LEP1GSC192_3629 [Leptospira sp. B5-022]MCR1795876.1 hypothetical protein [Leptospira sp. id769339]
MRLLRITILLILPLLVSIECTWPKVRQDADGTLRYTYKNERFCIKSPEYTEFEKSDIGLKIKEYVDIHKAIENRWEKVKQLGPQLNQLDSAFFDLCNEYALDHISLEEYRSNRKEYEKLRKDILRGSTPNIEIVQASYGPACGNASGNRTEIVRSICLGKKTCGIPVNNAALAPDPFENCPKDFRVSWLCGAASHEASHSAQVNEGYIVTVTCE